LSYSFTFDLSRLSQAIFKDIASFSEHEKINEKIGTLAQKIVEKFHIDTLIGLPLKDSIVIIEDLIDINLKNSLSQTDFLKSNKRALCLPHCCRKYMDSRCKATFDTEFSSYRCAHCSQDCLVHLATLLAEKEHYDIYVLPGGSGVRKIFQKTLYNGVVGVACTDELRLATQLLEQYHIPAQVIPLTKNGCSGTQFNLETLRELMEKNKASDSHLNAQ